MFFSSSLEQFIGRPEAHITVHCFVFSSWVLVRPKINKRCFSYIISIPGVTRVKSHRKRRTYRAASLWMALSCNGANNTIFAGYCFSVWRAAKSAPIVCFLFFFSSRATMSDPVPFLHWVCDGCRCSFRKKTVLVQLFRATHLVSHSAPHWVHSLTVNDWNDCNYYITLAQNLFSLFLFIGKINSSLNVVAFLLGKLFPQFYCYVFLFFVRSSLQKWLFSVTRVYELPKCTGSSESFESQVWLTHLGLAHNWFCK